MLTVRTGLKGVLKKVLLAAVSRLTGRRAVLLSAEARAEDSILDVRAAYRVEGSTVSLEVLDPGPGRLTATLLGYEGHFPTRTLWTGPARDYVGPGQLTFHLTTGAVSLDGADWGRVPLPLPGRRFLWRLELMGADGRYRSRRTGHYRAGDGSIAGQGYFSGENYVDHEAESAGGRGQILELLRRHGASGPVLEIGCATGGLLAALDSVGLRSVGVDVSEWAVARAGERLGPERAWICDVERDPLPGEVKAQGPFGTIVLAAVFEHFRDPFAVLAKLTATVAPGAVLVITTTNAGGLSRTLFGAQWEGYFDWTHRGIDLVSVKSLRAELPRLGWRVVELATHGVWDVAPEPTRATLREWWVADARFRRLLAERELGDLISCVAVRE